MFKNELQEYVQKRGWDLPEYTEEGRGGTEHNPIFQYSVLVSPPRRVQMKEKAEGRTKKSAQQEVARKMLKKLGSLDGRAVPVAMVWIVITLID